MSELTQEQLEARAQKRAAHIQLIQQAKAQAQIENEALAQAQIAREEQIAEKHKLTTEKVAQAKMRIQQAKLRFARIKEGASKNAPARRA